MARLKQDAESADDGIIVSTAPPPEAVAADNDLAVLHPEIRVTIRGQSLVAREYGFVEGLRLRPIAQPLLDDLYELLKGEHLGLEQVIVVLGKHHDLTVELMAASLDVDVSFFRTLNQKEGQRLLMAWWTANGPFYLSTLQDRVGVEAIEAQVRANAGAMYTQPSSERGMEAQPISAE